MDIVTIILKKQKFRIISAFTVNLILLGIVFMWNKGLSDLINSITRGLSPSTPLIIHLSIILFFYVLFSGFSSFVSNWSCEQINYEIRRLYVDNVTSKGAEELSRLSAGGESSKLLNEVSSVCGFISGNLFFILESAIKFTGTFCWFLILNPLFAIATNLPVFLILIYVSFTSRILKNYSIKCNEEKENINALTETIITLFPIINLYKMQKLIGQRFVASLENWESVSVMAERKKSVLMSLSAFMTCIPLVLTVWFGGIFIIRGKLTFGELYIFINLSGNVSGVLMNMPAFIGQLRVFAGNLRRIK